MTQDELKQAVANAALHYVEADSIVGVGTGSTARFFIEALSEIKTSIKGAVASSEDTKQRLEAHGIKVFDLDEITDLPVYVDGADEITPMMHMIKGGGGALTREKIVAAVAKKFVCIIDESKFVGTLGAFPLPIEVIPMAKYHVMREMERIGGKAVLRDGFITDNGNIILDVHGLSIHYPLELESRLNHIPGIVNNGLFSRRPADVCLIGTAKGVKVLRCNEHARPDISAD